MPLFRHFGRHAASMLLRCCTLIAVYALFPMPGFAAQSDWVNLEQSQARLISSVNSVAPGQEFTFGLEIILKPHWHTYTYDPGDSGLPVGLTLTQPSDFKVGEAHWPPHQVFNEAGLTTYGFSHQLILTFNAVAPAQPAADGSIQARADYLVCKDICIPQTAELTLYLPAGNGEDSPHAAVLQSWLEQSKTAESWGDVRAVNTAADTPATAAQNLPSEQSIIVFILLAFMGGIILNLMPCVFPVLSLKALAIARHAAAHPRHVRREGIAYTGGVLTCFWILAGLLIALGEAGEVIGWGFQFQSTGFVALMSLLLFFIGLNLSGLFELPVVFGNAAHRFGNSNSLQSSYMTGLLAALVATPCTAPFMAAAIGFALSQPPVVSLVVFTALGLGLAFPFILISYMPRLLSKLPKPGPWMETLKHFLAFPMYLSALWMLWILGTQAGADGVIITLLMTLLIIFVVWAKARCTPSRWCMAANLFVILALLTLLVQSMQALQLQHAQQPAQSIASHGVPFSAEALAQHRAAGTPVFVDATASWCITCKVNYRIAISRSEVQQAFKERGVVYMVADWTNRNPDITRYLTSYGFKGVPLYVYYAPNQEGVVLPQILTPSLILESIAPSTTSP